MNAGRAARRFAMAAALAAAGCGREDGTEEENAVDELRFEQEVTLEAPADWVWRALTEPEIVDTYYLAPLVRLELEPGGHIVYGTLEQPLIEGRVLEVEPGRRLVHSFSFDPGSHPGVAAESASRVTYDLRPDGDRTVLRLVHDGFGDDGQTHANVTGGWPIILSRLEERVRGEAR